MSSISLADTTRDCAAPIRVALVDDQQLVRAGFRMVIDSQPDMTVVLEAGTGLDAIQQLSQLHADIALMDIRMPVLDGLAATVQLSRSAHKPRIIVLTTFDTDEYVFGAIRAGASGFLVKDAPPEDMLSAIRAVHRGDAVVAPSATRRLLAHLATTLPAECRSDPHARQLVASLTEREREVLVLMARGRSNTEIGTDLFVAEATVKTHVGRILAKLGVRDRVQAVVLAYEASLIIPGQ